MLPQSDNLLLPSEPTTPRKRKRTEEEENCPAADNLGWIDKSPRPSGGTEQQGAPGVAEEKEEDCLMADVAT